MANFAVVGAGLAGVSLANRLEQAGHNCSVFEKSRGRGGRLSTRRLDDWQVDHGTQYFTVHSDAFKGEVEQWLAKGLVEQWQVTPWILEADNFQPSPDQQTRYVGVPTMNAMVRNLSETLTLYAETRIDRLEKQDQQWRIWDEHGEQYGLFDAVLLTAPLAQSLALLPEGSPAEAALRMAVMSPTWAFAVALEQPSGIEPDALFANDGLITWAARDSSKPGRPQGYETWAIHFSSKWSQQHLEASTELLHQQAIGFLERLAGKELSLHDSFHHRWLYARSNSNDVVIPQWDAKNKLGLAGDWAMGSRLEHAWLSAQVLANRIIEEYKR